MSLLSSETPAATASAWKGRIFSADLAEVDRNFGKRSFALRHTLAHHPLFTPERLALAAERAIAAGRADRFVAAGRNLNTGAKFSDMGERPKIAAAIADLKHSNAWMKLSTIHAYDPDYADLLSDALADLRDMSSDVRQNGVSYAQFTVFMASPNMVTPFHIDHENNFLSQIAGEKKVVCLYPPDHRALLPAREIEAFYVNDISAATYKAEWDRLGEQYNLLPGVSVHHPSLAPHWVNNGDDMSISLSLSFCQRPLERRARVHQVNYHLRKLGMAPPEPRPSNWADAAKAGFLALIAKRNPRTYRETVFSGVDRLRKPYNLMRRILGARRANAVTTAILALGAAVTPMGHAVRHAHVSRCPHAMSIHACPRRFAAAAA